MIAAVSLGLYDTMEACVTDWVEPYFRPAEAPNSEIVRRFNEVFPAYRQTRQALRPVWHAMADDHAEKERQ